MPDRRRNRPVPPARPHGIAPHEHLAGAAIDADRLLAGISDAVAACLARQRWQDLETAVERYAIRLGVRPIVVFNSALVRIYVRRALTTRDAAERLVCRSEIARLMGSEADAVTLADAIAAIRTAVRHRDAADALLAIDGPHGGVH